MKNIYSFSLATIASLLLSSTGPQVPFVSFEDSMSVWNLNRWKVIENAQTDNPKLPCMDESDKAFWKFTDQGAGMRMKGKSCTSTLAVDKFDLFYQPYFFISFSYRILNVQSARGAVGMFWKDKNNNLSLEIEKGEMNLVKTVNGKRIVLNQKPIPALTDPSRKSTVNMYFEDGNQIWVWIDNRSYFFRDKRPFLRDGTMVLRAKSFTGTLSEILFSNVILRPASYMTMLKVPYFSQKDPKWAGLEYDSAKKWSREPTIGRWGCALTSVVGILHFHGFSKFADNTVITPATLNTWLKGQSDGYVGNGLLNWNAIVRLTRDLAKRFQKTSLTYSKADFWKAAGRDEITANRPFILEVPGHFVNVIGLRASELIANDPNDRTVVDIDNVHEIKLSMRKFTPAKKQGTNLLLTVPTGMQATLTISGKPVSPNPDNPIGTEQKGWTVFEATDLPIDAHITVHVQKTGRGITLPAPLYMYRTDGGVTQKNLLPADDKPLKYSIRLNENSEVLESD